MTDRGMHEQVDQDFRDRELGEQVTRVTSHLRLAAHQIVDDVPDGPERHRALALLREVDYTARRGILRGANAEGGGSESS